MHKNKAIKAVFQKLTILAFATLLPYYLSCGGYWGGEDITDIGNVQNSISIGDIIFEIPSSLHIYGIDVKAGEDEAYISMPNNGQTQINVTYTGTQTNPVSLYSSDAFALTLSPNPVILESNVKTTVTLQAAINDLHRSVQLIARVTDPVNGDRDLVGSDGKTAHINVELYMKNSYEVELVVIRDAGSEWYDPPSNLQSNVNILLSQVVDDVASINIRDDYPSDVWDINGNNALDYYQEYDGSNSPFDDETQRFLGYYSIGLDCKNNNVSALFVMRDVGLKKHYQLTSDAYQGFNFIYVYGTAGIMEDATLVIRPMPGYTGNTETVTVSSLGEGVVYLKAPLAYDHLNTSSTVAATTQTVAGITIPGTSCSFCSPSTLTSVVFAHEYLHHTKMGELLDVVETDNLMYYTNAGSTGNILRYRPVSLFPNGSEMEQQWNKVARQ